jgi:5-formyltetrahydrofolate cyclo-ligase
MDKTQKAQVRKRLITERLALPDRLERAELLQRVMRIWLVGRPDTVIGAYWPIKGEFDPLPALYRWQEDGALSSDVDRLDTDKPDEKWGQAQENRAWAAIHFIASVTGQADRKDAPNSASPRKIGLPVVDKVHKTLTFYAWYPGCPMEPDAYDIPKPKDTEIIVPTLLFVPCLGYGLGGYRLGYGGGFYDRTLAELQPKPVTVGLGFSHGFVPDFIAEPHDVPLDAVLTDRGQAWP